MESYVIYHHGVKGMRWGIRRTPAQLGHDTTKKRRGVISRIGDRIKTKKMAKQKEDEETKKKNLEAKKTAILKSRNADELYKNAHLFTTQELQAAYNRLLLEKNIKSLAPDQVKKGKKFVSEAIDWGKKANDMLETGGKLYNNIAKLYNTFGDRKTDLPLINMGEAKKFKVDTGKKKKSKSKSNADSDANPEKENSDKSNDREPSKKEKVYTGEVEGEGTSRARKSKNGPIIDVDFTEVGASNLPVAVSRGRDYVSGLLDELVDD